MQVKIDNMTNRNPVKPQMYQDNGGNVIIIPDDHELYNSIVLISRDGRVSIEDLADYEFFDLTPFYGEVTLKQT